MKKPSVHRRAWIALAIGLGLLSASCGSDDETSSSSTAATTTIAATTTDAATDTTAAGADTTVDGGDTTVTVETTAGGDDIVSIAQQVVADHQVFPTKILTSGSFTPVANATIYNVACDQSLVGCSVIAGEIKGGVEALGYTYILCDAGKSPQQATGCFNNAINAKADAIITNAVGTNVAGNGYAAAKDAGIPIAAIFSGDPPDAPGVVTEVGDTGCASQGAIVADYIISTTEGKANALFVTESSIGCNILRTEGFMSEMAKCTTCKAEKLEFDRTTIDANLPRQLNAAIQSNPDLNYVVGVLGAATTVAATSVEQSGRDIAVAGLDGDPANIERVRQKQTITATVIFGRGEAAWTAVDAMARTIAGEPAPKSAPAPIFLVNTDSADAIAADGSFNGPTDFREQFKALWGKS